MVNLRPSNYSSLSSVLVVGETGSGKSTFINTLTNYFLEGSFPNDIKVSIETKFLKPTQRGLRHSELNVRDTTSSQTNECTEYKFTKDGHTYVFIDTPGLSDTRGIHQDEININKIINAADQASSLSAIILLINGKDCRDVISLKSAITRLQGSIPDVILNNLVIVFTKCQEYNRNFDLKALGNLQSRSVFHMENSAFSTDPATWNDQAKKSLKREFKESMFTVNKMMRSIARKDVVSTSAFGTMRNHRFKIKQTLHKAKIDIKRIQDLQDEVWQAQIMLGQYSSDQAKFQNYTKKKTVMTTEMVDTPYHNTICSECNHVCHEHCGLEEISSKGDNAFTGCVAMNGLNNCSKCPERCSYITHYHGRHTIVKQQKTLEVEIGHMKDKYQKAQMGMSTAQSKISSINDAKQLIESAIKQMTHEITSSCQALKQICSGFNLVDELVITITQMEMEAKLLTSFEARRSADTMIQHVKMISDSLSKDKSFQRLPRPVYSLDDDDYDDDDELFVDSDDSDDDDCPPVGDPAPDQNQHLKIQIANLQAQLDRQQQSNISLSELAQLQQKVEVLLKFGAQPLYGSPMGPCKVCTTPWTMLADEASFFQGKGIPLPRTCRPCRVVKKQLADDASAGLLPVYSPTPTHTTTRRLSPVGQTKRCTLCYKSWILNASEQSFYVRRGLPLPKKCHGCRDAQKHAVGRVGRVLDHHQQSHRRSFYDGASTLRCDWD
ncbi:hypothetical protein SAMD00019534_051680 [Acytostelium subglobosum LB1]|uniref:hypothetical protein n=1 Tax=Acytostelium subglobosum LB1 TaxID=1410327 RepID=UPI000644A5F7|nr:hypothetical protein SAMD00019534_051680 [Acytostelium subglobosum LB1]GAM21993.1 hypothetical protein SAMD00019534_051680 [Acytostelium subglobosum LB1]|eukprot:XP_012755093.1 hypothetical protein SAMD00019534_051680 [Acytostelium subglobosum LB1]